MTKKTMTRREATKLICGATAAGMVLPFSTLEGETKSESSAMLSRVIPSSGEKLPVIGLGTWQVFDVELTADKEKQLAEVLSVFARLGGRVIDSSPMYGRSEEVIGALMTKLGLRDQLFLATKVWTRGKAAGIDSIERSLKRFQAQEIDLMQVHNLVDVETQLATLRDWKDKGRVRYIGITHYNESAFPEVEKILKKQELDFLQINYSVTERAAEQRILPLAQDRRVAVIVNRPFGGGDLISRVRSKPLPEWAVEFDCRSWAQLLLKWIVVQPAVTCVIPATNKTEHLRDNLQAGWGGLPDGKGRERITQLIASI